MTAVAETRTIVHKRRDGWEAITYFEIGPAKHDHHSEPGIRSLRISTSKRSRGGISTSATAVVLCPDGTMSWLPFEDFNKHLIAEKVRCTEKSVREQHAKALEQAEAILAEAKAFYAGK